MVFLSFGVFAQLHQFNSYSTGILEYNATLFNQEDEVIGYILIYNKGYNEDETKLLNEFVILDNNLNKITNGNFDLIENLNIDYMLYEVKLNKGFLDITYSMKKFKDADFYGFINTRINIKTKEIVHKKRFGAEGITEELAGKELIKNGRIFKKYDDCMTLDNIPSSLGSYFVIKTFGNCVYTPELASVTIYNSDLEKIYHIGETKAKAGHNLVFELGQIKEDQLQFYVNYNRTSFKSIVEIFDEGIKTLHAKTGEVIHQLPYNPPKGEFAVPVLEKLKDKTVVTGEIKKGYHPAGSYFRNYELLGVRRQIIDENNKVLIEKNIYFSDILKSNEEEKEKYFYKFMKVFNFNDFSFTVVLERNQESFFTLKNNLYLLDFDKEGNLIRSTVVDRDIANYNENDSFLFSQFDRESKEILFYFYNNEKINKKIERSIVFNKYQDGKLNQEKKYAKIEDTTTKIYPAKYGHVLMIDYDKKNHPVSLRLERSNL